MQYTVKTITSEEQVKEQISQTPFLVVTRLSGARFNRFEQLVDEAVGGLLTAVCGGWNCEPGTHRLLYLPALLPPDRQLGELKYILVAGLGHAADFHARRLCAFTALTLHEAAVARVEKITFIESPNRSTEETISLQGTAAIMRCRADLQEAAGKLRFLREVEYLASPQARRYLESGAAVDTPRCRVCTLPTL